MSTNLFQRSNFSCLVLRELLFKEQTFRNSSGNKRIIATYRAQPQLLGSGQDGSKHMRDDFDRFSE